MPALHPASPIDVGEELICLRVLQGNGSECAVPIPSQDLTDSPEAEAAFAIVEDRCFSAHGRCHDMVEQLGPWFGCSGSAISCFRIARAVSSSHFARALDSITIPALSSRLVAKEAAATGCLTAVPVDAVTGRGRRSTSLGPQAHAVCSGSMRSVRHAQSRCQRGPVRFCASAEEGVISRSVDLTGSGGIGEGEAVVRVLGRTLSLGTILGWKSAVEIVGGIAGTGVEGTRDQFRQQPE